jgi:hypothetical protein
MRLSNIKEEDRPSKVLFAILTDGEENSSHFYTKQKVKEMITHQQSKYSWGFIFLATNQDAFAEAVSIGIPKFCTANYVGDGIGTRNAYSVMNNAAVGFRNGAGINIQVVGK